MPQVFYRLARGAELHGGGSQALHKDTVLPNFTLSRDISVAQWRARACTKATDPEPEVEAGSKSGTQCRACLDPPVVEGWGVQTPDRGLGGAPNAMGENKRCPDSILSVDTVHAGGVAYGWSTYGWVRAQRQGAGDRPVSAELGQGVYPWSLNQAYVERRVVHAVLADVFVSGNDGLISDANRRVYASFHGEQVPYYANLPGVSCGSPVQLDAALLLVFPFGPGYYHWLMDAMPRLVLALQHVADVRSGVRGGRVKILVPSDHGHLHAFIGELLWLAGVGGQSVWHYDILPHGQGRDTSCARVRVRRLHVVDWVREARDARLDTHHLAPRHALQALRRALLARVLPSAREPGAAASRGNRRLVLYVQRARVQDRVVKNESAIIAAVQSAFGGGPRERQRGRSQAAIMFIFSDSPQPLPIRDTVGLFARAVHLSVSLSLSLSVCVCVCVCVCVTCRRCRARRACAHL